MACPTSTFFFFEEPVVNLLLFLQIPVGTWFFFVSHNSKLEDGNPCREFSFGCKTILCFGHTMYFIRQMSRADDLKFSLIDEEKLSLLL